MKEKKFETAKELIEDDVFRKNLNKIINKISLDRNTRPLPKPGYHYKRDGIDEIMEQNNLTVDYFSNNIESIWNKQSKLSSRQRTIISSVCNEALYKTFVEYGEKKEKETKKTKTK